jgi:hypothetical protein
MNCKTHKQIQNEHRKKNPCIYASENSGWGFMGYDTVWSVWDSTVSINL